MNYFVPTIFPLLELSVQGGFPDMGELKGKCVCGFVLKDCPTLHSHQIGEPVSSSPHQHTYILMCFVVHIFMFCLYSYMSSRFLSLIGEKWYSISLQFVFLSLRVWTLYIHFYIFLFYSLFLFLTLVLFIFMSFHKCFGELSVHVFSPLFFRVASVLCLIIFKKSVHLGY